MAKKLSGERTVQLRHDGTNWRLRFTSYAAPEDDTNPAIQYKRLGGGEGPRDLTTGELNMSLQAFLNLRDVVHKTTEGIP